MEFTVSSVLSLTTSLLHSFIFYPVLALNTHTRNWSTDVDYRENNKVLFIALLCKIPLCFICGLSKVKMGMPENFMTYRRYSVRERPTPATHFLWSLQSWKIWTVSLCQLQDGIQNIQKVLTKLVSYLFCLPFSSKNVWSCWTSLFWTKNV